MVWPSGSLTGRARVRPDAGAPEPLTAGEEAAVQLRDVLLLGAADAPVSMTIAPDVSPFGGPLESLGADDGAASVAGTPGRTIVAAEPISDLFIAAPDALVALAAGAMAAEAPEDLALAALAYLEAVLPNAQGRAVKLCGAGFSIEMTAHAYALIDAYLYGFALQEANLPATGGEDMAELAEGITEHFPVGEYPYLMELTTEHVLKPGYDFGNEFEFGL